MIKLGITIFSLSILTSAIGKAQKTQVPTVNDALEVYNFIEGKVLEDSDTITYYLKNYNTKPQNLVVFIQGTDPNPIFTYNFKDGKPTYSRWFNSDYTLLDSTYTYAIIPKPGMEGIYDRNSISVPKEYNEKNYLDYRIKQIDLSIQDIIQNHLQETNKIIVYGHSEGAAIAAPLVLKNKSITHLGFWSGNVLNNFYEFSLFSRIESLTGKQSDSIAHGNIMDITDWYEAVIENPNSTDTDHFGYTNKRWSSHEKPPIEYLLEIDIPIYAVFATEDESTPIETAYLIPIQFIENRKDNLTFEVCMNCNHAYIEEKNGETIKHWQRIFKEFINWTKIE